MLKEVKLGHEAVAYIREVLAQGRGLATKLLDLPLESGTVRTFLPEGVSPPAIRNFKSGGMIKRSESRIRMGEFVMEPIERGEMDEHLTTFIADYLSHGGYRYAIFENVAAKPDSPWLVNRKSKYFVDDKAAYFYVGANSYGREAILQTIRAGRAHFFIGVLADLQQNIIENGQRNALALVNDIALQTEFLLIGAYDGEAELIWSR